MMFDRDSQQHNRRPQLAALLIVLCGLSASVTTAPAQDSPSQRRLTTPYTPQKPLEQLRLLMQQQQLKRPLQLPPVNQLQNALNLSDEQLRQLGEALQRSGMIPPNLPALSEDGLIEGVNAESMHRNLQRGPQQQPSRRPHTSSPLNTAPDASARNSDTRQPSATQRTEELSVNRPNGGTPAESNRRLKSSRNESSQPATRAAPSFRPSEELPTGEPGSNSAIPGMASEFMKRFRESRPQTASPSSSATSDPSAGPSFDLGDELSRRGFRRTFRRLVQDVRKKVGEQSAAGDQNKPSEPSTWNRAIAGLLDSVRDDVVETVRTTQQQRAERSRQRSRQQQDDVPNESSGFGLSGTESPATAAAGNSSGPPSDSSGGISSALPDDLTDLISAPDISSGSQMLIILAGLAIAAVAVLLSARRQTLTEHQRRSRALQALKPEKIRSREDIIRAFHWLTLSHSPDAAEWWNHLQAGESLSEQAGSRQESLRQLMELYEIARYQSADTPLEPAQLQLARTALTGCLS